MDTMAEWLQERPFMMVVAGTVALVAVFWGHPRCEAVSCLLSGGINTITSFGDRYQKITIGRIATLGGLLSFIGMWSAFIGLVNIDGNRSVFLLYASIATGTVAIAAFLSVVTRRD